MDTLSLETAARTRCVDDLETGDRGNLYFCVLIMKGADRLRQAAAKQPHQKLNIFVPIYPSSAGAVGLDCVTLY